MSERFYITTPIYYVNDAPHLGHAYTTIVADALARYHRARGQETYLLTGTDEHGQKVEDAAQARGVPARLHADQMVERFKDMWKQLDIKNDDFIRTTEDRHKKVVVALWQRLAQQGDIYLGEYEGWYCRGCEAFYTELQLEPGLICPQHKQPVERLKEQSYFFRMSKYEKPLLEHYEKHPDFVRPEARRNEIVSFIRGGLRDLSVSRSTFKWGIPVPNDPGHIIYVWIDALTNYVSALGGPGAPLYEKFWPHAVHLIGKDIIRFHCVYWPCMLLAAGWPLPRTIVAHGWWTVRGQKISKSIPATRVDPTRITADLGNDGLRYFLLREIPLGGDGDFVYESLIARWNSDLANDLGNLVNRTIGMAKGELAPGGADVLGGPAVRARVAELLDGFQPSRALEALWELVRAANNYIAQKEPFRLPAPERAAVLSTVAEAIRWIALLCAPVLPDSARRMYAQLGLAPDQGETWPQAWAYPGSRPAKAEPLFPRIDERRQAELLARWLPPEAVGAEATVAPPAAIDLDHFQKIDLRVALITEARKHPKAEKLYVLSVDAGEGRPRQVVAGLAGAYKPEDLVGRRVILVANLKPATIRGILSEGMILAAGEDEVVALAALDREAQPGVKIR
ncbi:MAG TPA: methionine--tRNA ligase [Polyangia bacterium]|nr:methionine--tRNA ligase [Polyangia bacterium]